MKLLRFTIVAGSKAPNPNFRLYDSFPEGVLNPYYDVGGGRFRVLMNFCQDDDFAHDQVYFTRIQYTTKFGSFLI